MITEQQALEIAKKCGGSVDEILGEILLGTKAAIAAFREVERITAEACAAKCDQAAKFHRDCGAWVLAQASEARAYEIRAEFKGDQHD